MLQNFKSYFILKGIGRTKTCQLKVIWILLYSPRIWHTITGREVRWRLIRSNLINNANGNIQKNFPERIQSQAKFIAFRFQFTPAILVSGEIFITLNAAKKTSLIFQCSYWCLFWYYFSVIMTGITTFDYILDSLKV